MALMTCRCGDKMNDKDKINKWITEETIRLDKELEDIGRDFRRMWITLIVGLTILWTCCSMWYS